MTIHAMQCHAAGPGRARSGGVCVWPSGFDAPTGAARKHLALVLSVVGGTRQTQNEGGREPKPAGLGIGGGSFLSTLAVALSAVAARSSRSRLLSAKQRKPNHPPPDADGDGEGGSDPARAPAASAAIY
jgi:hypothetical protein